MLTLFLLGSLAANAQDDSLLLQSHIQKFKDAETYCLAIAGKLDAGKYDFKPVPAEMSFKEQLIHLAENIYWLSSTYIREEANPLQNKMPVAANMRKEEVLQLLQHAYEYGLRCMQEMDRATLSREFKWAGGKLNKYQFLNLIQDHQSHHLGQLIVYLRLNGIEPPKYIGW